MNREIDLKKLKERLPRGYGVALKKIIEKKYNKIYHVQSIRRGLTDRSPNDIIIKEAILLAEATEKKEADLVKKFQSLK
jgi:hypothetical protein